MCFMNVPEDDGQLQHIPIKSLAIGAALRRQLIAAGFKELGEVFESGDAELDERIGVDSADQVSRLKDSFRKNPDAFAERYCRQEMGDRASVVNARGTRNADSVIASVPRSSRTTVRRDGQRMGEVSSGRLPLCDESDELRRFEKKALRAINIVADHAEDAFVAEALDLIATDIFDLRKDVSGVFAAAQRRSSARSSIEATKGLTTETPNAFLLYMLDSVQRNFTGDSVWHASFDELGIKDQTSRVAIPHFVYDRIKYKGFNVYNEEETQYQYFYTALLHAGLAESDWVSIWSRLIIPLVRGMQKGRLPDGAYPTAADLIRLANDKHSGFYLANRSAQNLIHKVPEVTGPMLVSALSVAETALSSATGSGDTIMASSGALPTAAMNALKAVLDSKAAGGSSKSRFSRLVYFPNAELRLSPEDEEEPICIHWERARFPRRFAGRMVTYRVNGEVVASAEVLNGVESAVLEEVNVRLAPSRAYDVEVELSGGDESTLGRLFATQSFRANHPGVYEFVSVGDGVLRQKRRPLRRKRTVYCLVAPGFEIRPGSGMVRLNRNELSIGHSIETFEMDDMGCGEVCDSKGAQVSAWCEGFRVTVDRSRVIGEGMGRSDLYPSYRVDDGSGKEGFNDALPSVTIEGRVDGFDYQQLDVELLCDGQKTSVKRKNKEQLGEHDVGIVSLRLDQSMIPNLVADGRLRVVHRKTGALVLNYRFSVVPIRRIALESARVDGSDTVVARYGIDVKKDCAIRSGASSNLPWTKGSVHVETPLSDEWLAVEVAKKVGAEIAKVRASIFLAGIDIVGPAVTRDSCGVAPDAYDLQEAPADSKDVTIRCQGRRASRGAYLSLGQIPCFYKMLPVASRYRVSPFSDLRSGMVGDGRAIKLQLVLNYECGQHLAKQPPCVLDLGSVVSGFNFGECSLRTGVRGCSLELSRGVDYDLVARFSKVRGDREIVLCDDVAIPAGAREFELPRQAEEALVSRGLLRVTFACVDVFGDADFSTCQRITIKR